MSGHWDDHDVVRMARRVRDVELALDARRQELEWVVSERDSLRARVEELEDRLAAWEPVVRAVGVWFDAPRDSDGERMAEIDIADSYCDIPPEHRPEVER